MTATAQTAPPAEYRVFATPKTAREKTQEAVDGNVKQTQAVAEREYTHYRLLAFNPISGVVHIQRVGVGALTEQYQANPGSRSCTCPSDSGYVAKLRKRCKQDGADSSALECKHCAIIGLIVRELGVDLESLPHPSECPEIRKEWK